MTDVRYAAKRIEPIRLPGGGSINGYLDARFGAVLSAFVDNHRHRSDLGSGCTVVIEDRVVVDLWGGVADRRSGRAWEENTASVVFSSTKGILALLAYLLVQDGVLDLDEPIATYWPEFAQHGKEEITIRHGLSHRAGLPAVDSDLDLEEAISWVHPVRALENQVPYFAPSDGHFYHAMTMGWIVGEVIRRTTGSKPGALFHERLADPLGLQTRIGARPRVATDVAWMEPPLPDAATPAVQRWLEARDAEPLNHRSHTMGAWPFPEQHGVVSFNHPLIQSADLSAASGISSPRSLAMLYAACLNPTGPFSQPLLTAATIEDALNVQAEGQPLSGLPDDGVRWGTGFQLASAPVQPMLSERSFGHAGAGGQLAFADPLANVGFGYVTNQLGGYEDARARSLTQAVSVSLG